MVEMFSYAFMQRALVSGFLIGILCAVIGVYVILKGLSFIGAGISHASFGGVALGFLLGVNPVLSAVVFCLFTGWGIGLVSEKGSVKEDTAVGVFFAFTMALGILFIGMIKGYTVDLFGYLFGSILAVTNQDMIITAVIFVFVILLVKLLYKELLFITFDPEMAAVEGLPAGKLYFLLLSLIALTVVVSIKVVGIILVSALIVTPAAASYQWTENFKSMMFLSVLFGVFSTTGGLFLSYWLDIASGATIVILATLIFFVSIAFSPRRKVFKVKT